MRTLTPTEDGRYSFEHGGIAITVPTQSECGRFIYDPADPSTERILREYGFEVWQTGGGNTAWRADFVLPDGRAAHMLVTDNDLSHEARPGDTVIGVYLTDSDDGEALAWWADETEADLCDSLANYCAAQGLECRSADEMLAGVSGDLTAEQRAWLTGFVQRWDRWEDAQRAGAAA
jgi:hypothetical protein